MELFELFQPPLFFCLVAGLALIVYTYAMLKPRSKREDSVEPSQMVKCLLVIESTDPVSGVRKGYFLIPRKTVESLASDTGKPVKNGQVKPTPQPKPLIRRVKG